MIRNMQKVSRTNQTVIRVIFSISVEALFGNDRQSLVDGTEVIESEGAEAVVCANYMKTPLVRVMSVVDFRDCWCRKGSLEER